MDDLFINRKKDKEDLSKIILSKKAAHNFIVVYGNRGIGKSSLIKLVLSELNLNYVYLRNKQNEITNTDHCFFFKALCREILNQLSDDAITVFLQGDFIEKEGLGLVLNGISDFLGFSAATKRFYKKKKEIPDKIQTLIYDDQQIIDICIRFVKYFVSKNGITLFIENFQEIDDFSLAIIIQLVAEYSDCKIICEYVEYTDDDFLRTIYLLKERGIQIQSLHVKMLDKNDLVKNLMNNNEYVKNLILNTYDHSKGNLKNFSFLYQINKEDPKITHYDKAIQSKLNGLSSFFQYILISVSEHKGSVKKHELLLFLKQSFNEYQDSPELCIDSLIELKFLNEKIEILTISHDSIIDELDSNKNFDKIRIISKRNWLRYYEFLEDNEAVSNEDEFTIYLYQLYFILRIEAIDELPSQFRKLVEYVGKNSYLRIIPYLDQIELLLTIDIEESLKNNLSSWLTTLYYRCGILSKVISYGINEKSSLSTIGFYLTALSSVGFNKKVLQQCDNLKKTALNLKELYPILELNIIRSLRSSNKLSKSKKRWYKNLNSKTFENTSFQADFYRYIVLIEHDDYSTRIKFLNKALRIYNERKNLDGIINTNLDLSRDHCYINDVNLGIEHLHKAKSLAKSTLFPWYVIMNNESVLQIIQNINLRKCATLLESAMRICENNGDRKILLNNYIIVCIILRDETVINKLLTREANLIENIDFKSETDLRILYHLQLASQEINNYPKNDRIDETIKKMKILKNLNIWDYLKGKSNKNPYPLILKNKYYPCFMVNWNIDYYASLNN